jgi:hypothetical protein
LTKAITIVALTCVLIIGAAMTSILTRDRTPPAGLAASVADLPAVTANREGKQDKLTAVEAAPLAATVSSAPLDRPLRQAYASSSDADFDAAKVLTPPPAPRPEPVTADAAPAPSAPVKPKVASHPQAQKYALLSDAQIAGIKQRLKLTSSQEYYWPGVEQALRAVARKIEHARHVNPNADAGSLDPDSAEVQQLKSAAMPLLFQLREDQKDEVRKLARIIGLDKVAAAI